MREKIQTGLRLPQDRYEELLLMAEQAGVSLNSVALMMIDVGISVIRLGKEEALHALLRNQQDICE